MSNKSAEKRLRSLRSSVAWAWVAVGLSVILQSGAMMLAKQAGLSTEGRAPTAILGSPWLVAQLGFLAAQALTWPLALRKLSLSLAYPLMSLTFPLNVLGARIVFGEALRAEDMIGTVLITSGLVLILGAPTRRRATAQ